MTRPALIALGVSVWAVVSVSYVVQSWPQSESIAPPERQQVSCDLDGKIVTDWVVKDTHGDLIYQFSLEPSRPRAERGQSAPAVTNEYDALLEKIAEEASQRRAEVCAILAQTQLPLRIVFNHYSRLREAIQRNDFNPGAFLVDALKREAEADAASERARRAVLQEEQLHDVGRGLLLFVLPLVGLALVGSAVRWARGPGVTSPDRTRRTRIIQTIVLSVLVVLPALNNFPSAIHLAPLLPGLMIMIPILRLIWQRPAIEIAGYVAFAAAFACLWTAAAAKTEEPFTEEQWRLLGWALLAVAGAITWHRRSPASLVALGSIAPKISESTPLDHVSSTEIDRPLRTAVPRVSARINVGGDERSRVLDQSTSAPSSGDSAISAHRPKLIAATLAFIMALVAISVAAVNGQPWAEVVFVLLVSTVMTWGFGLLPPLLVRFALMKRPLGKFWSMVLVALLWILNLAVFTAMGSESRAHSALVLVALASYFILRKGAGKSVLPKAMTDSEIS